MEFRPCIDIHNGSVKQIVGGSLSDVDNHVNENYVSEQDATFYAKLYEQYHIKGGHIILLNKDGSEFYTRTKKQAMQALEAYPGGLQIGGGITPSNASEYIQAGASHVIVTSYVFCDGKIQYEKLAQMKEAVGKEHLVLDLSCRKKENDYYVVTDRWQRFTKQKVNIELLEKLQESADEFLIHAVDVEGKQSGVDKTLVRLLGEWDGIPITYAGGVHSFSDLDIIRELGNQRINVTIGSALDIFGGPMAFADVLRYMRG